ncbi:MAG: AMP-binding protein [Bryobacteraceae bacterium]|nr:AMP-binding protein [Bryobacteraceae bacterium]
MDSLLARFLATAQSRASDPAVHYFEETISWGELGDRAARFATYLANLGVGPGDRVAIQMQNDPEFLVAQYAAWMRGAIVVPVSPMFKEREVAYAMSDSGAKALIRREDAITDAQPQTDHEAPHELAYLVYTSGTTGQPKGAMCQHAAMLHTGAVFESLLRISREDVILGLAPLFHVTGLVAHMALSARTGAPLVLFHRFDAERCWQTIERWRPTVTVAAITAYMALANHPLASRERFRSMTKCFTGGAPVSPAFVERFERELGAYIHNTYGLTESNSPATITPLGERGPVDPQFGALAIGRAIPGCEARIEPDGELALRGANVFAGYWNKPEATAAAFREGWFLTGDIATEADGWFFIVDRKKDMINASGFKVYPREVEDVLYQHPAVREAAVIGVPDEYRGETVKAFVALRDGSSVTAPEIVEFCRERMAAYKYPREVEFLDAIPKTATGKFLRRELRGR